MPTAALDSIVPAARCREHHERTVDAPIDRVWHAVLSVTAGEVRALGPLIALRSVPARVLHRRASGPDREQRLLDIFETEGFIGLGADEEPTAGHARLVMGAAGRFWSPSNNTLVTFESAQDFLDFNEPGFAKTVFDLQATKRHGRAMLSTETIVAGTDPDAEKFFSRYWRVIRLPSGLIRRSWLAAIDRRAASVSETTASSGLRSTE